MELAQGADLCVATLECLGKLMSDGIIQVSEVVCLVIDEADQTLSADTADIAIAVVTRSQALENRHTLMVSEAYSKRCQQFAAANLYKPIVVDATRPQDTGRGCTATGQARGNS